MPGKLTWNGIPLCVPDPDGELERWLAQFHRIQDIIAFCGTETAQISSNNAPRSQAGTGITTPNYPDLPPLTVNELIWPTGATRFGYFVGLIPGNAPVGALGSTAALILSDGTNEIKASMQLLAYRPISANGDPPLWLIVLVDRRYSWQFINAGNIVTASGYPMLDSDGLYDGTPNNDYGQLQISYEEVFAAMESAIGTSITRDDVSGFLVPDVLELSNRKYFNVAQMLDAVAQSCGLRVWLDFNGTPRAQNAAYSYTRNFNDLTNILAGGLGKPTPQPAGVTINFRRASQYRAYADNDVYPVAIANGQSSGGNLVVESCAYAHWLTAPDNYVNAPSNASTISGLANAIAAGVFGWHATPYDATFAGVKPWTMTGWDNFLAITYAAQIQNDREDVPSLTEMTPKDDERFDINYYRFTTRAQSMPANFGSYINLSQDPSIRFLRGLQWGKLAEATKQPINGTTPQPVKVNIWQLDSKFAAHNTGISVQAVDISLSTTTLTQGTTVYLWFHEVNRMWVYERVPEEQAIVRITGTSSVANMSQKNSVCVWPGTTVNYNTDYTACSSGQYEPKQNVWIAVINNDGEVLNYLPNGDRYLGRSVGTYAVNDDSRPLYVIRADHHLVRFQLRVPMLCGQESPANNALKLYWDGTQYTISSQTITVVDPYFQDGAMFAGFAQTPLQVGSRGFAEWQPDRRVYEIVYMQSVAQWIEFQISLDSKLSLASESALAKVVSFWGGKNPDPANQGIKVYQMPVAPKGEFFAPAGAYGYAVLDTYRNRYQVVFVQTWPYFISGTLIGNISDGVANGNVANQWSPQEFVPVSRVALLDKSRIFTGSTGAKFQATLSAADEAYIVTWVQCSSNT